MSFDVALGGSSENFNDSELACGVRGTRELTLRSISSRRVRLGRRTHANERDGGNK